MKVTSDKYLRFLDEFEDMEKEFGMLLASNWELVLKTPSLQKKAMHGAKRLQKLRLLLAKHKLLTRTIQ